MITLRAADAADLRWVDGAVRQCPVAMAEFGGFYGQASVRLPPLLRDGRELLIIERDGVRLGFLDVEPEIGVETGPQDQATAGPTLGMAWFVVPEHRGANVTADAVAELRERHPDHALQAAIDPENGPSLGAARRAGFVDVGVNRWGERVLRLS